MVRPPTKARLLASLAILSSLVAACAMLDRGGSSTVQLFDGATLAGWRGDPRFWSVRDGMLVGESTAENPCERTTYLVWSGGPVADFELSLEYRIHGGNSGIQFRSHAAGEWDVAGYQADLDAANEWTGGLYEQGGRGVVARRGERVALLPGGGREVAPIPGADAALDGATADGWNHYRVTARGQHLELALNGIVTSTITDLVPGAPSSGLIALQLHQGPPMRVELRDIQLVDHGGSEEGRAALDPSTPRWIWSRAEPLDGEHAWLRTSFDAPTTIASASLWATCDNRMELFVNGTSVAQSDAWERPVRVDVREQLRPGTTNVLAAWARNDGGPAGFCAELVLRDGDGRETRVRTDGSWRASRSDPGSELDAIGGVEGGEWAAAKELGALGVDPWGLLGPAGEYVPDVALAAEELELPPGFRAELVYSVPRVRQGSWVALAADERGRLYASDQYGALYRVTLDEDGPPVVEELEIELGEAHGLCWAFGALHAVVSSGGAHESGLYRARDTDGDDRLDRVELLARFDGGGEHGPHAVVPGPDGESLFVVAGNHTDLPEYVERSRVPRCWEEDSLLPRIPDPNGHANGRLAPGGWICRTDPDARRWELVAVGMRNSYDLDFDPDGEIFTYDADMEWDMGLPWYRPPRILHVTSGAEFGWRHGSGKWPTYYPDSLPSVVDTGPASPTGVVFGTHTSFPERWRRAFFAADWAYGTIHAVHLEPRGATFAGTVETFVSGRPLPVTDLAVGPDGALYFTTGGRRTQSGLYRVTWAGGEATTSPAAMPRGTATAEIRRRHSIEGFHTARSPLVPDFAWEGLRDEDRFVRFAARTVLEHVDPSRWSEAALAEEHPRGSVEALLALVRLGGVGEDERILARILSWPWDALDEETELAALRGVELALLRLDPDEEARVRTAALLGARFPTGRPLVDHELCRLLARLDHPGLAEPAVGLLEVAETQEERIDYAFSLRVLQRGWDEATRARYLAALDELVATAEGGLSLRGYLERIRDDAGESMGVGVVEDAPAEAGAAPETEQPARALVQDWTLEDLLPSLGEIAAGRSFERGREAYTRARCAECHRMGELGQAQGPDLFAAGARYTPRDLLESVVEPSRVISDTYRDTEVWTVDERVFVGRVEETDGGTLRLRTPPPADELIEIPVEDVAEQRAHPLSRMPEGLLDTLTEQEILDLLAFVLAAGDPQAPAFRAAGSDGD